MTLTQRRAEFQPRLRERWLGGQGGLFFYNVGGPAIHVVWVGWTRTNAYAAYATLPGHFADYMPIGPDDLGPPPAGTNETATILLIARSLDDEWWDCKAAKPIQGAITAYIKLELESRGLTSVIDRVFEIARLSEPAA